MSVECADEASGRDQEERGVGGFFFQSDLHSTGRQKAANRLQTTNGKRRRWSKSPLAARRPCDGTLDYCFRVKAVAVGLVIECVPLPNISPTA